jgi:hypothetical protein
MGKTEEFVPASQQLTAQIELVLRVKDVTAYPPRWRETGQVDYLYREFCVLTRDADAGRTAAAIGEIFGMNNFGRNDGEDGILRESVVQGLTRLSWQQPEKEDRSVERLLNQLDRQLGAGVARPDHLLYVCGHCCAATEPEEVPVGTAAPSPRVQIGQDAQHPLCGHGRGVRVSIYDTGLVADAAIAHPWLAGVTGDVEDPVDPGSGHIHEDGGHGTFVAGCVRAQAPESSVHVVGVATATQNGFLIGAAFESNLARELERELLTVDEQGAVDKQGAVSGPDIIVFSYAGSTRGSLSMLAFDALYENCLQYQKELVIVAPAGNSSTDQKHWPAAYPWVVSVGALAENWRDRADFSNFGRTVDVYAPGEKAINAFATGTYECHWDPDTGTLRSFTGMAQWSGTSFSAPLVAGLIAGRMSSTGENSRRAANALLDLAWQQAVPGVGGVLLPGQGCC